MPTVEIPLPGTGFAVHHVEPNRIIEAADFNQISGDTIAGSWMEQLIAITRMMLGSTTTEPQYLGFRVQNFGGPGPGTFVNCENGIVIDTNGIWPSPALTLQPTNEAHFGHFEFSLEEAFDDERTKQFFSIEREEFDGVVTPTSKRRYIRLYEKYEVSATMPATTPGRIRWIEYRKEAAFQRIISLRNWLTAGRSTAGFMTGDVKYSVRPGDAFNWLTCDGSQVPAEFQDLINWLRGASTHPAPLTIAEVRDDGNGLCRVRFPGGTNLKNIRTHPGPQYACLEILTSNAATGFSPGTYKIKAIAGSEVTIALAYAGGTYTGTASVRPYSVADEDGGGARTPVPGFLRPFNPGGDAGDVNRLPNTYQVAQMPAHDHGGATSAAGLHSHTVSDPGHTHFGIDYHHALPGPGVLLGYGAAPDARQIPTVSATTGITIAGAPDHTHTIPTTPLIDADNPTENRPANLSMYLLIKT